MIDAFLTMTNFVNETELNRVRLLAFYWCQVDKKESFSTKELCDFFSKHGLGQPNVSRLKKNMLKSKFFVRGQKNGYFMLHKKELKNLINKYPTIDSKSEEIITDETILPENLYMGTRGYIERLAIQINASYHYNIFDGCAILMRRLLEVLLVKVYDFLNRRNDIEENGSLKNLSTIINYTLSNNVVSFHKESREILDTFRELGNLSAHRVEYNARRADISSVKVKYRALIEELLYASGIKK